MKYCAGDTTQKQQQTIIMSWDLITNLETFVWFNNSFEITQQLHKLIRLDILRSKKIGFCIIEKLLKIHVMKTKTINNKDLSTALCIEIKINYIDDVYYSLYFNYELFY